MSNFEEYKKNVQNNGNATMFARDSYSKKMVPLKSTGAMRKPFERQGAFNPDLDTPEGLLNLSSQVGLGKEAQRMVRKSGGESQRFFSGGFLMDAMDILNIGSYGVAGLVKGKGFKEGIKNRESFSDEDSLGQYGWGGKLAGFALDIALDPLTYIAPWKHISKIPGIARTIKSGKEALVGDLKVIQVEGQSATVREGGWTPLKLLSDKLVYGFAVDRKYLDSHQKIIGQADSMAGEADKLIGMFSKLDPVVVAKTLSRDTTGRFTSTSLSDLQRGMSKEEFGKVKEVYDMRDDLMAKLTDLGVISKETSEEHWGTYLKQSYDEFMIAKNKTVSKKGIGITKQGRKEGLTPEKMEELGHIKDPSVVWGTTLLKQIELVRRAELNQLTAKGYSLTADQLPEFVAKGGKIEDLHLVQDTPANSLRGKEIDITKSVGRVNVSLKKIFKERKVAFKDNKELLSTIKTIEKKMDSLKGGSATEISEAISGMRRMLREGGLKEGPLKKAPTSLGQKALATSFTKWLKRGSKSDALARETIPTKKLLTEFLSTDEGIALEKAFNDPRMMYQWKSPSEFVDAVRHPGKAKIVQEPIDELVELTDAQQLAKIKKAEAQAREFGSLEQTKKVLEGTNLKLVDDVVNKLEDDLADSLFKKSQLLDQLEDVKMGQLGGKYVSKDIWDMLKGVNDPRREIGEKFVLHFKHMKVVWNPGSHARNAISSHIQNWWRMGIGPWRADLYHDARREIKRNGKAFQQMKELGFSERSGQIGELVESHLTKDVIGEQVKSQLGGSARKMKLALKHMDNLLTFSYGHTDNIAKVVAFKHGIKKGMTPENALKAAYEATYNYSQITPFVHQMRRAIWGVPFITFALKSVPLVGSTLKHAPHRISVFGKARNDLFKAAGVEGDQEAEAMPDYMRDDMFVMRLPWKDGKDRPMYFDLSYIIPFGSIMNGDYAKDPITNNPVLQTVRELSQNRTFSGSKVFNESDDIATVTADIFIHIAKLGLPPVATDMISDGYDNNGQRRPGKLSKFATTDTQDRGPNERSFYQEMFRLVGLGVSPFDTTSKERQLAYKQKENLTQLLVENNILDEYRSPYLPKDSPLKNEPFGREGSRDRAIGR